MAENESFHPVLITGASGGGKSALVANWCATYAQTHPETLLHLHHLGAGAAAADPVKLVTRLIQEIARITGDELKLESDPQKLLDLLPEWLARASAFASRHNQAWLLIFDGLDKLSSLRDLRWWPAMLPPKVKLIASCLDGEVLESLRKRMEWTGLLVRPLSQAEQRTFITEFLGRYRKSLTPAQVERLLAHELSGNPLFLLTLLEELRVFGVHEQLEQRLSFYLTSETVDDLFERVLERVEGDTSPASVRAAMEAIWASRAGLAQDELLAIAGLVPATWAPIHNALDEAILESGGRLDFGHDYFRKAVEDRYLPVPAQQQKAHLRLAEWFDTQEVTARVAEELPWQWQQAGEGEKLKECLTQREMFMALHERDEYELLSYWLSMKENIEAAYGIAWKTWEIENTMDDIASVPFCLAGFLKTAGYYGNLSEFLYRFSLGNRESILGEEHRDTLACVNNLGGLLIDKGDHEGAEALLRRALEGQEKVLGPDHLDTLGILNNLGCLLSNKGDYEGADALLRRALAGKEKTLGPDHPDTLATVSNLGSMFRAKSDYEGAEVLYRRALEGMKRALGADHLDMLKCINNLGVVLKDKGDYDGAEVLYRRAIEICEKVLGPDHPGTLMCINNLGNSLSEKGDYKEAEVLYRRVLEGRENALGPQHLDTLSSVNNLGALLRDKGDFDGATAWLRRGLDENEKTLGPDHPNTAWSVNNLVALLRGKGDNDGVEALYRRVLTGKERVLGIDHQNTLSSLDQLGNILIKKGDYDEAEALYRRALEGKLEVLGPNHPDTLKRLKKLAILLKTKGDYEGAEMLYRNALEDMNNFPGPDHPDTLGLVDSLGLLLSDKGDSGPAEELLRRALDGRERVLGLEHPDTLMSLNHLGTLLIDKGDYDGSETFYRRALAGMEKIHGPEHPDTLWSLDNLGALLKDKGDYNGLMALYLPAIEGREKALGPNHPDTLDSVSNLGDILRQMGKLQDAVELLSKYALVSDVGREILRYNLARYECLSGNEERARQMVTDELSTSDDPAAGKAQMLEDADFQTIHDFIRSIPVPCEFSD